ncbi:MAG: ankyrin repeat domain-containing protein, partial [Blastocatellia bacterium]
MSKAGFRAFFFLVVLIATTSAFGQLKQPILTPERVQARKELGQLSIQYTTEAFVSAAANGDTFAVQLFLKAGMSPGVATDADMTPLLAAAVHGQLETIKSLVAGGADPNRTGRTAVNGYYSEPLAEGARLERKDIVQFLLNNGADPNVDQGDALKAAISTGNLEIVKLLLSKGMTLKNGPWVLYAASKSLNLVSLLVDAGAQVAVQDSYGATPIMNAASRDIAGYLLDRGADVNKVSTNGNTALKNAIFRNNVEFARFLIDKGADVNLHPPAPYET